MNETKYLVIAILASLVAVGIIIPKMCPNTMNNLFPVTPKVLRFQKVETFTFDNRPSTAIIYEDTKTGVRYLYLWHGSRGGPCMTRLWEK